MIQFYSYTISIGVFISFICLSFSFIKFSLENTTGSPVNCWQCLAQELRAAQMTSHHGFLCRPHCHTSAALQALDASMETGGRSSGKISVDCALGGVRAAGLMENPASMGTQERQAWMLGVLMTILYISIMIHRGLRESPTAVCKADTWRGWWWPRIMEGGVPTEEMKQQIRFSDPIFHFVPGTCLAPQSGRHLTLIPFLQQPGAESIGLLPTLPFVQCYSSLFRMEDSGPHSHLFCSSLLESVWQPFCEIHLSPQSCQLFKGRMWRV